MALTVKALKEWLDDYGDAAPVVFVIETDNHLTVYEVDEVDISSGTYLDMINDGMPVVYLQGELAHKE